MTIDEIRAALRMIAQGRPQQELADNFALALEALFARVEAIDKRTQPVEEPVKRGPGRPRKALDPQ